MILSHEQNEEKNTASRQVIIVFEQRKEVTYLETNTTKQNSNHEKIKRRLKSANTCILSCLTVLIAKNLKIHRPVICLLFLWI